VNPDANTPLPSPHPSGNPSGNPSDSPSGTGGRAGFWSGLRGALQRPVHARPGVLGVDDPKWLVVAACYIAAVALMALDPWFGEEAFTYTQGVFVVVLAVLIVAGIAWESCLLGRPRGVNLVLHIGLIAPVTLLIGRFVGRTGSLRDQSLLDQIWHSATWANRAWDLMPDWIVDVFRSPFVLILILFVSLAFTQRAANRRIGLLLVAFLIPGINAFANPPAPSGSFTLGMACLAVGLWLQAYPYAKVAAQQNVLQRLKPVRDSKELQCSLRLAKQALDEGFVSEEAALSVVQRTYGDQTTIGSDDVREMTRALTHRLVREHRVLELHGDERGYFLVPNPTMYEIESLLDEVTGLLRKTVLTLVAICWLLSPIDLFPDFVPLVGVLDDVLIGLIGAGQWADKLPRRRGLAHVTRQ